MKYAIHTFGCQMNVHDSERMHESLRAAGWTEADRQDDADLVILNTCSVREKAEQKLRSEAGRLKRWKRERPDGVVVVAGCVAQQEGERLLERLPAVDVVIGPDNIPELGALVAEVLGGGAPAARTRFDVDAPSFLRARPAPGEAPVSAFSTIMKGCDERCSFCIVPYTRGPERYRPSTEIVEEARALVEAGTKEITLLGQTVNSYADPSGALPAAGESQFAELLRAIAAGAPGLARLRYTSPHPRHLGPALVRAHAELPVLPRHVHLPVQSGSDRMLKRMIRRYTRDEYLRRVDALRAAVPDVTLSTDVIVGFSGESEEDFEATLSLVREVGFTSLFGFKYSPRPLTPARRLPDDVTEEAKAERLARLFELSEAQQAAHLRALVGTVQTVLIEGTDEDRAPAARRGERWTGRSGRNEIVHVAGASDLDLRGRLVRVVVQEARRHSLEGTLEEGERAQAPAARAQPKRRSLTVVGEGA